jgi:hypothetical protein
MAALRLSTLGLHAIQRSNFPAGSVTMLLIVSVFCARTTMRGL